MKCRFAGLERAGVEHVPELHEYEYREEEALVATSPILWFGEIIHLFKRS